MAPPGASIQQTEWLTTIGLNHLRRGFGLLGLTLGLALTPFAPRRVLLSAGTAIVDDAFAYRPQEIQGAPPDLQIRDAVISPYEIGGLLAQQDVRAQRGLARRRYLAGEPHGHDGGCFFR